MTRNEFIATTAARLVGTPCATANNQPWTWRPHEARIEAVALANEIESYGVAPWRDQPPAPSSVTRNDLVERAHVFATFCACGDYAAGDMKARAKAWLADYEARKPDAAPSSAAMRVVEAAVAWCDKDCGHDEGLHLAVQRAVRAYKESVQ